MLRNCVRSTDSAFGITSRILAFSLVCVFVGSTKCYAWQAAPTPPPPDPKIAQVDALVVQANQFLQNANWDQAITICNQAIGLVPVSPSAYVARGRAYNGKGDYDNAIKDFDWVATQPPRDLIIQAIRADAYSQRSFALYQKGQYLPAVDSAYLATLEKGDFYDAHFQRAHAYLARSEWDKAIRSLDRAIQISPNSGEAYSERGYAYGGKGNFDQCIADQKKALELQQNLPQAYQRRGAAFLGKKDFEAALRDLQQALTLKPDFGDALCDRALLGAFGREQKIVDEALVDAAAVEVLPPSQAPARGGWVEMIGLFALGLLLMIPLRYCVFPRSTTPVSLSPAATATPMTRPSAIMCDAT